jgi:hypothetical protein
MDKKLIVKFLKLKRRGVYTLIVETYSDVIQSMNGTMSLDVIKEDLEKASGEVVDLKYFSLVQAISKHKSKALPMKKGSETKWNFKDTNELKPDSDAPGKFKL